MTSEERQSFAVVEDLANKVFADDVLSIAEPQTFHDKIELVPARPSAPEDLMRPL